jgi:hypothetical protein
VLRADRIVAGTVGLASEKLTALSELKTTVMLMALLIPADSWRLWLRQNPKFINSRRTIDSAFHGLISLSLPQNRGNGTKAAMEWSYPD